jgi:ABC-type cobalamin/Fe3+-siderophores transport system ATPase subunit
LSFTIDKGTLNVVIGKIGSGKSTLLLALLDELQRTGDVKVEGTFAYSG